ncbi:MAG: branched-chain amino acid transaminase [Candidatus Latescibacteria bacterium]|nr:branched-chain amino acid transaminase [Candidatus Latescibacterota bacterium]
MPEPAHPAHVWLDGEIVPWERTMVHVTDAPLFIHAVFEGIRAYWNPAQERLYIFRLDAHLKRLLNSIKLTRMRTTLSKEQIAQGAVALCGALGYREDIYIRPLAYFDPAAFQAATTSGPVHVLINTWPRPSQLDRPTGLKCCVSSWTRIVDNILPARVKCLANYRNSALASTEASFNGYDWAIMINSHGKVSDGTGSALMLVRDGVVLAPTVTDDVLESVTHETLIQVCREVLGVEAVRREMDRTELYSADEAFLCGTGLEVAPISSVDGYTIGNGGIGPITQQLRRMYHDLVRGIDRRYEAWRTAV